MQLKPSIKLIPSIKLNPSIKSYGVFPDGFNSFRRDRPGGRGGGVFLLVSQQYESHQPEE